MLGWKFETSVNVIIWSREVLILAFPMPFLVFRQSFTIWKTRCRLKLSRLFHMDTELGPPNHGDSTFACEFSRHSQNDAWSLGQLLIQLIQQNCDDWWAAGCLLKKTCKFVSSSDRALRQSTVLGAPGVSVCSVAPAELGNSCDNLAPKMPRKSFWLVLSKGSSSACGSPPQGAEMLLVVTFIPEAGRGTVTFTVSSERLGTYTGFHI